MKVCQGSGKIVHDPITYTSAECPLCKSMERNEYLVKRTSRDKKCSYEEASSALIMEMRAELLALDVAIQAHPEKRTTDYLRSARNSIHSEIEYLHNVHQVKNKHFVIKLGGAQYTIPNEKIDEARALLIGNKIPYEESIEDNGFDKMVEKLTNRK